MKYQNKLVRNGNSTGVSIPRRMLEWLQWTPGQPIIVEANMDKTVTIRLPRIEDLATPAARGASVGLLP